MSAEVLWLIGGKLEVRKKLKKRKRQKDILCYI